MTEKLKFPTFKTVKETAEITGLAKNHIRQLVLNNQIKTIKAGKKILINLDYLVEFLNGNVEPIEKSVDKLD